jgi:hypothetical protein
MTLRLSSSFLNNHVFHLAGDINKIRVLESGMKKLIFKFAFLLNILFPIKTEAAFWHNMAWLHRKPIIITGSTAGAQTNYQTKVTVGFIDGKMNPDFSDIRFASSDGTTLLNHWRESYTASISAVFWVNMPSLPASPATITIYMYYSNSSAATAGNGDNTFLLFDNFGGSGLDAAKWTQQNSAGGSLSISNSQVTFSVNGAADYVWIHSNNLYTYPVWVEGKMDSYTPSGATLRFGESTGTTLRTTGTQPNGNYYNEYSADVSGGTYRIVGDTSSGGFAVTSAVTSDTSGIWSFAWAATGSQIFNFNYLSKLTGADSAAGNIANYYLYAGIAAGTAGTAKADWLRIRKYASSEPAAGTPGTEENYPGSFFGVFE